MASEGHKGTSVGLCVPHMTQTQTPTIENFVDSLTRWTDETLVKRMHLLPSMNNLVLYGRGVSDYGLKLLENCQELRELHLVDTSITDKGLSSLANISSLRWLTIDTAAISDQGIAYLKELKHLEGLQLVNTKTSDESLGVLLNYPKLAYLEASGCSISEKGILFISQIGSLNYLRLAAPTVQDDAFLGLSFCKRLNSFAFDMPLVTKEAVNELHSRLPECEVSNYTYFRPEDKVLFIVSNFFGEGKTLANFADALGATDELLQYSPFHPVLHSARALINFRMGKFDHFRYDLKNVREHANMYGHSDLSDMAMNFLSQESFFGLRQMMEQQHPERLIVDKLLSSDIRLSREPIAALIDRLKNAYFTPMQPRLNPELLASFKTPNYRQPQVTVDLSNRTMIILPRDLKEQLKGVPWNW